AAETAARCGWVDERTQQREAVEIDSDQPQPCRAADICVAIDELAVRKGNQHLADQVALVVVTFTQDAVVEYGLGEWDRQHLLRPEAHGVAEERRVLDARDVEHANTDAVARDPKADVPLGKLVLVEESLERDGKCI